MGKYTKKIRKGAAIVEVVMAVGVISVVLLGLVVMTGRSVTNTGFAKRQSEATAIANQALEWLRAQKQSVGWDSFRSSYGTGTFCYNGSTLVAAGCTYLTSEYSPSVSLNYSTTPSGRLQLDVDVAVSWYESGRLEQSRQSTTFVRY